MYGKCAGNEIYDIVLGESKMFSPFRNKTFTHTAFHVHKKYVIIHVFTFLQGHLNNYCLVTLGKENIRFGLPRKQKSMSKFTDVCDYGKSTNGGSRKTIYAFSHLYWN